MDLKQTLNLKMYCLVKEKRIKSHPVLWQKPLYQQKIQKSKVIQYKIDTENFDYTRIALWDLNLPTNFKICIIKRTHI